MKEVMKDLIKSNANTLVHGMSGWGKSQVIEQSAKELGMKCHILSLAGVAPEDFGIPTVKDGFYEYLPPKWAYDAHKSGEDFVLFLDEMTQATIQVMHAIYPIVLEKRIGGLHLPNMRVIAASNYDHENPNLTTVMKPLLNRFAVRLNIEADFGQVLVDDFWKYISAKYPAQLDTIELLKQNTITTNPRAYENGLRFLDREPNANPVTRNLVLREAFGDLAAVVQKEVVQDIITNETHDDARLRKAAFAYKHKIISKDWVMQMNPTKKEIIEQFQLTEEEQDIVFI